jgi:hypothetical protein
MSESLERGELFRVTDPLGRVIRCTQETWIGHVLHQRAWMAGRRQYLLKVVVQINANTKTGEVITAHPATKGQRGEKLRWI